VTRYVSGVMWAVPLVCRRAWQSEPPCGRQDCSLAGCQMLDGVDASRTNWPLLWRLQCPKAHAFCADFNFWSHALEYVPDTAGLAKQIGKARRLWVAAQRACNAIA
jgi:hypothetical protein